MLRGIGGRPIFADKRDKVRFCLILQAAHKRHDFRVHACCRMSNHLHLLIEPRASSLTKFVHAFASKYAQAFNRRHKRNGYLFQGRFRSIPVQDGLYLKRLIRYVHLNTIEAGLTLLPEDFPWSSHRTYLDLDSYTWLSTQRVLKKFGNDPAEAIKNLNGFLHRKVEAQIDFEIISQASSIGMYGSEAFMKEVLPDYEVDDCFNSTEKESLGLDVALMKVCEAFDVNMKQLMSSTKGRRVTDA